jgi:hypothetical protein
MGKRVGKGIREVEVVRVGVEDGILEVKGHVRVIVRVVRVQVESHEIRIVSVGYKVNDSDTLTRGEEKKKRR